MTPRQRVLTTLAGEVPDCIPFIIWHNKLPGGDLDRQLLALECCVVWKTFVYEMSLPEVEMERRTIVGDDGQRRIHTQYHTACGMLEEIARVMPTSLWTEQHLFRDEQDYDALETLLESRTYTPCYERFQRDDTRLERCS